ncbi:hypothetical protein [Xylophilus sp. GOD-11R]|uniref:hypothetical protein n=1 Tax=Xylophilus sp. GOD-11R TaxID=3089814 RepID=UPI00298D4E8A|nr:hypothetical protein [Xylophilus sp. GOD-11R]WPB56003.1 hypothetical protein R9X41_17910 [Xylophilus sp. GOD-11R]
MHSAASVAYPVLRSRREAVCLAMMWLLGAAPVVGWLAGTRTSVWAGLLVGGWTIGVGLAAMIQWLCGRPRMLRWNGEAWSIDESVPSTITDKPLIESASISVSLDLQSSMLLRLKQSGRLPAWVFVDRSAAPQRWHALRCAVTAAQADALSPARTSAQGAA